MNSLAKKMQNSRRRSNRVRTIISYGPADKPRLSVNISNYHVSAQIIDDNKAETLASVTTVGSKVSGSMSSKAEWVGAELAKKAAKSKIKRVSFDRGSRKYHGRVKILAEAARKGGLEF